MRQLTYTGPNELEWREAPEPSLSSDAAALVRPTRRCHLRSGRVDHRGELPVSGAVPPGPRVRRGGARGRRLRQLAGARTAGERALPDLLRRVRALPAGPHRELCGRGVHVQLRLRARGRAVGRVPVRRRVRSLRRAHARACPRGSGRRRPWRVRRTTSATPGARSGRPSRASRARRCWWLGARAPVRSVCMRQGWRSRSGPSRCCTSTPMHGAATRRASSARRRWPSCPSAWAVPDHGRLERRPRRSFAGAALDGAGRHLHEHRDLLRRAALATAAGDVHEGHHLRDRPRERPPGDAARAGTGRRRASCTRSSSPRTVAGRTRRTRSSSAAGRSS